MPQFVLIMAFIFALSACGQKGGLYLPPEPETEVETETSPQPEIEVSEEDA